MKTAEEVFLSVLEKELDFVAEDKLKSVARALVDRLGMENVKFFDVTCDAKDLVLSPKLEFPNPQTKVYDMYQDRLQEEREEKPFYENPCK